jgi:hypothetical protein
MRRRKEAGIRWLIVAGLVLGVPVGSAAQGLGAAAQKEAARRKANAEAGVKARSVDNEALQTETGTGKGTFSSSGAAPLGDDQVPAAEVGKPRPEKASSESGSSGATSEPSGMDLLQSKIETWRARYRPVKSNVDSLEREIADLEARASKIAGIATDKSSYRDPKLRTDAERTMERLPRAREQLSRARQQLSQIEDGARRDGVSTSQL